MYLVDITIELLSVIKKLNQWIEIHRLDSKSDINLKKKMEKEKEKWVLTQFSRSILIAKVRTI